MNFSKYLRMEWVKTLGCTEPASIAYAAATARQHAGGRLKRVKLVVDPKMYKNCYAVGIPQSGHRTGIKWAVAIGANIENPQTKLECLRAVTATIIDSAEKLINAGCVTIEVDTSKKALFIDCFVESDKANGRAVIEGDHTNIIRVEKDGKIILDNPKMPGGDKSVLRSKIAGMSIAQIVELAKSVEAPERDLLREGTLLNKKIAEHGLSLLPKRFVMMGKDEKLTEISKLVCAGVYARMWGEDFTVMSLAGSGNKGIVVSVPLSCHGSNLKIARKKIDEALALACLVTTATTHHLGALSAVCGCSNAAGIGLACGLVLIEGGGEKEIGLAINNMVGNVTGMICDGAKIGCALKTMTSVDSAFRAASLALSGIGIPPSDGIVGKSEVQSLENLGRIATDGMISTDREILAIMEEKLNK